MEVHVTPETAKKLKDSPPPAVVLPRISSKTL